MPAFSRVYPSPGVRDVCASNAAASLERDNSQGVLPVDLILPQVTRIVCWAAIMSIQLLLVAALSLLAFLYARLHQRDSLLWLFSNIYLFSNATTFLARYYVAIASSFAFFALVFSVMFGEMLFYSLRYRALAYGRRRRPRAAAPNQIFVGDTNSPPTPATKPVTPLPAATLTPPRRCYTRSLQYLRSLLTAWTRTFGIRGRYFSLALMLQEVIEIALQTSQAHASSKFVSNLVLNQVYGVLICGNCVSTLLVCRLLGADSVFARLVCVMIDLALDFVWGVVLPFWLLYPRLVEYYSHEDNNSDLTTSAELIREEIEHLMILSRTKFVWNFFPYLSTVWNVIKLRRLLALSQPLDASTVSLKATALRRRTERVRLWQQQFALAKALPRLQRVFHCILFAYGLAVLCVSIHSTGAFRRADDSAFACIREVYPWFATRKSCSMRRINCTEASIAGTSSEITAAMGLFNADALTNMEITDCAALEMSPALLQFVHLRILGVKSSRIASWPAIASVEHLSALVTLKLYRLQFDDVVPGGLLTQPTAMEWVSVYDTDISSFERAIGTGWHTVKYMYCDKCHLTEVPAFVLAMQDLREFSLCDNAIAIVPDALFVNRSLVIVYLDGNPLLRTLPSAIWQPSLFDLYIQDTGIMELPVSASERALRSSLIIYAANSPVCAQAFIHERYDSIADRITCEHHELLFGE